MVKPQVRMLCSHISHMALHSVWRDSGVTQKHGFELIVDSANVGLRKPEPEIYELTVERLGDGLRPSDCLFIDDVEVNIDAARRLGMQAVHFRANEQAIPEIEAALDGRPPG